VIAEVKSTTALRAAAAALLFVAATAPAHAAARVNVHASDAAFAATARSVVPGGALRVEGLILERELSTTTLDLQRFEVWRPDARIEVDGRLVPAPRTAYFRGGVDGEMGSIAFFSVRESGDVRGIVQKSGATWVVGKGRGLGQLRSRQADLSTMEPFQCGQDSLYPDSEAFLAGDESPTAVPDFASGSVIDQPYSATIAIETDYEYYAMFGNTPDALDYMADLIGYADVTYSREIDTDMSIGFARLWTGGAGSDPWTIGACGSEPCGTDNALYQFRDYWNANQKSTSRTVAHMLSGKGLGGGIAYIGVLCQNYGSGSTVDYGLSASLGGGFNWDGDQSHNPASVLWDIVVVQHEIGHNFNSPHSHDYCNVSGNPNPIDRCWAGCQSKTGLPSCSSPTPMFHNSNQQGEGTIMSYCHLHKVCSGSTSTVCSVNADCPSGQSCVYDGTYGNISMTFGGRTGSGELLHTCGDEPEREAARMRTHVVSRAASYPSCFVSSSCGNGVIDAGEECDGGDLGGATCGSEGFVGGTLSCTSSCTFDTSACSSCGNGVVDDGEVCDGGDLGGATCGSLGCTGGGALACNFSCSGYDDSGCSGCPACDHDGLCEAGEDCYGCADDCASGFASGAVCGNGICETADGENCATCPADCAGKVTGKPSGRSCCGTGDGYAPEGASTACDDPMCTTGGYSCTTTAAPSGDFCCGLDACQPGESCSNCALDCGNGFELCDNGIDDDCNGQTDCDDAACNGDSACLCGQANSACSTDSDCCSGNCRTNGKKAFTCS